MKRLLRAGRQAQVMPMPTSVPLEVSCELEIAFNERSLKGKELAQGD